MSDQLDLEIEVLKAKNKRLREALAKLLIYLLQLELLVYPQSEHDKEHEVIVQARAALEGK